VTAEPKTFHIRGKAFVENVTASTEHEKAKTKSRCCSFTPP